MNIVNTLCAEADGLAIAGALLLGTLALLAWIAPETAEDPAPLDESPLAVCEDLCGAVEMESAGAAYREGESWACACAPRGSR